MKHKNVVVLALVAVVLVVVAIAGSRQNASEKSLADGGLLAPALQVKIDEVADIRLVSQKGDNVSQTSLVKKADQWIVADKNYRADTTRLMALVTALAQAKRIEAKTAKPEYFAKLGVLDPAAAEKPASSTDANTGAGTLVRLLKTDGAPVFELIVGSAASGRDGRYVRVAGDNQVWLIDRNPEIATGLQDWLDRSIADIAPQDIVAVDFGGLALKRPATDKALELAAIPAGRELSYDGVTAMAASALSQLQLKDVMASDAIKLETAAARTAFTTKPGATITVDAYRQGDKNYLKLSALAPESADDATRKQVDAWNAAWQPWVFEVETFTYNKFVKSINDFTQDKPKPQKAG